MGCVFSVILGSTGAAEGAPDVPHELHVKVQDAAAAVAHASHSHHRGHEGQPQASDESSAEEESRGVHVQRMGVELPLDPADEELTFQSARIFKIENLEPLKKLRVRRMHMAAITL